MEVLPRIRNIQHVTSPSKIQVVERESEIEESDSEDFDVDVDEVNNVNDESTKSKFSLRENIVLVVVFAAIIIVLIVLIVWLVTKNDKYLYWLRGKPLPPPASVIQPPVQYFQNAHPQMASPQPVVQQQAMTPPQSQPPIHTPKSTTHSDVIRNTSAEELAKFANLQPKPKKEKACLEVVEESEAEAEDETEKLLNAKLEQMSNISTDNTAEPIDKMIDQEITEMQKNKERRIDKVDSKTGDVITTFETSEQIESEGYDYERVLACCNGNSKKHKTYKWKYSVVDAES